MFVHTSNVCFHGMTLTNFNQAEVKDVVLLIIDEQRYDNFAARLEKLNMLLIGIIYHGKYMYFPIIITRIATNKRNQKQNAL